MDSIIARVGRVFEAAFTFPASQVTTETTPDDVPKWDSLGHMSMVNILEKEFGTQFELDEAMEMATVRNILDILSNKGVPA